MSYFLIKGYTSFNKNVCHCYIFVYFSTLLLIFVWPRQVIINLLTKYEFVRSPFVRMFTCRLSIHL